MAIFPLILNDLVDDVRHTDMVEVNRWFAKAIQYNVPLGKKNRAVELSMAYKMLEEENRLTEQNMRLAYILGWCCEMVSSSKQYLNLFHSKL